MYTNLGEIIEYTGAKPYITDDLEKSYKFTNSKIPLKDDYVFVPMPYCSSDLFNEIRFHLKNENCKGLFISEEYVANPEYLKILREFFPKNVLVVKNVYNLGFKLAKYLAEKSGLEIIILAGTDETETVRKEISNNLKIENPKYETYWEKTIDSILRSDENTKYAIVETDLRKQKTAERIAQIKKSAYIIFSKISLCNMALYKTKENYNDEWLKLLSNKPKVVFAREDNDLVVFSQSGNIHFSISPVQDFLKSLNVEYKKQDVSAQTGEKRKYIDKTGSLYSIKKSIQNFVYDNREFKKIIIISKIPNLDSYSNSIHKEIFQNIPPEIDYVITFNLSKFLPDLRLKNKQTAIKRFDTADFDNLILAKQYLKFSILPGTKAAYLIISKGQDLWNLV